MEVKDCADRVDAIIAMGDDDPESMHGEEDKLMIEVLHCVIAGDPNARELARELLRTVGREDVTRWYA
jgi:hypothetical protein